MDRKGYASTTNTYKHFTTVIPPKTTLLMQVAEFFS